jgi:hypothetical protein
MHDKRPAHFILLYLTTLIIFGELCTPNCVAPVYTLSSILSLRPPSQMQVFSVPMSSAYRPSKNYLHVDIDK